MMKTLSQVEFIKYGPTDLIIRDLPLLHSNFRSTQSLGEYLQAT